jgi:hypothetical protein
MVKLQVKMLTILYLLLYCIVPLIVLHCSSYCIVPLTAARAAPLAVYIPPASGSCVVPGLLFLCTV